jgi:hypothetical protein
MATLLGLALLVSVQVAASDGGAGGDEAGVVASAAPAAESSPATDPEPYGIWDQLAQCESTGRWHIVSPPYYGGLQEDLVFWRRHGGLEYASRPDLAPREAQIAVARVGLTAQGWAAWPACSRRLGLR